MYQVVSRLSAGQNIIGYYIATEAGIQSINKETAIEMAKANILDNVKAAGDTITGINGFELKKLPIINTEKEYSRSEKAAAVVRNLGKCNLRSIANRDQAMNTVIYNDLVTGVINESMIHAVSNEVVVKAKLVNNKIPAIAGYISNFENIPEDKKLIIVKKFLDYFSKNEASIENMIPFLIYGLYPIIKDDLRVRDWDLSEENKNCMQLNGRGTVGYIIRGTDNLRTGLSFEGLDYTDGQVVDYRCQLSSDRDVAISIAEMAVFMARRTINGEILNAKLYHRGYCYSTSAPRKGELVRKKNFNEYSSSKVYESAHEYLRDHELRFSNAQNIKSCDITELKQNCEIHTIARFMDKRELLKIMSDLYKSLLSKDVVNVLDLSSKDKQMLIEMGRMYGNAVKEIVDSIQIELEPRRLGDLGITGKKVTVDGNKLRKSFESSNKQMETTNRQEDSHDKKGLFNMFKRK